MANFDYEIRGYTVEWKIEEKCYKQDGFETEDAAVTFAKKILKTANSVTLIQERHVIGWDD